MPLLGRLASGLGRKTFNLIFMGSNPIRPTNFIGGYALRLNKSEQVKKHRKKQVAMLFDLKHNKECMDCKTKYPAWIMQYDHVRGEKKFRLATVTQTNISTKRIKEEIEKCDLVCANCHADRTYKRRNNKED